jgi:hypothetical protein
MIINKMLIFGKFFANSDRVPSGDAAQIGPGGHLTALVSPTPAREQINIYE